VTSPAIAAAREAVGRLVAAETEELAGFLTAAIGVGNLAGLRERLDRIDALQRAASALKLEPGGAA
jgi:hypothetical protein